MNKVERIGQSVLYGSELPAPRELGDAVFYTLRSDCYKQPCVCVLGVFDGLHEGHQGLLVSAKKDAEARNVPLVAVTFLPDPVEVLFDGSPRRLLSGEDRLRALAAWGVDGILVHHFTREFAALSATQYVEGKLIPSVSAVSVHVGSDLAWAHKELKEARCSPRLGISMALKFTPMSSFAQVDRKSLQLVLGICLSRVKLRKRQVCWAAGTL